LAQRQVEGGALLAISQALYEELAFDESGVTTRDWLNYPIRKMAEIPEMKVVLLHRPEVGAYGQGSEAANALAAPAIAAAFFDATGGCSEASAAPRLRKGTAQGLIRAKSYRVPWRCPGLSGGVRRGSR